VALKIDGLFYETERGRVNLPVLQGQERAVSNRPWTAQTTMPDGRVVTVSVTPQSNNFAVRLSARPFADIVRWGMAIDAGTEEYFTGLMERVVDGPR
jgi:hypothetical protein